MLKNMRPEKVFKIPVHLSKCDKTKQVMINGQDTQVALYEDFMEVLKYYVYERNAYEDEIPEGEDDLPQDEWLRDVINEGRECARIQKKVFQHTTIRKHCINGIRMEYDNDDDDYFITIDHGQLTTIAVKDFEKGNDMYFKINDWWQK